MRYTVCGMGMRTRRVNTAGQLCVVWCVVEITRFLVG